MIRVSGMEGGKDCEPGHWVTVPSNFPTAASLQRSLSTSAMCHATSWIHTLQSSMFKRALNLPSH